MSLLQKTLASIGLLLFLSCTYSPHEIRVVPNLEINLESIEFDSIYVSDNLYDSICSQPFFVADNSLSVFKTKEKIFKVTWKSIIPGDPMYSYSICTLNGKNKKLVYGVSSLGEAPKWEHIICDSEKI